MIPKIIHYCWFGERQMTELMQFCVHTWQTLLPDYRIIKWTDMHLKDNDYTNTARKNKKYSNLSNYMRLHVLNRYGGIYLDTDVELLKSLDPFLNDGMFAGWQPNGEVNGAVLGAEAGHPVIAEALLQLVTKFDGNEWSNKSGPELLTPVLVEERGLELDKFDEEVVLKDAVIYPSRYFYPHSWKERLSRKRHIKPDTVSVHHWALTWASK